MRKHMIPGLGDTADLVVVGGGHHTKSSISEWWTTLYLACVDTRVGDEDHKTVSSFRVVAAVSRPAISIADMRFLNRYGKAHYLSPLDVSVSPRVQSLGAFDETDPKALHMLGQHGTGYANTAIQEADLIIAVGARFDDRVTGNTSKFAPNAFRAAAQGTGGIVQFEIAPKNIDKVVKVTESVVGECSSTLAQLEPLIDARLPSDRKAWFGQIKEWKTKYAISAYNRFPTTPTPGLIQTQAVIERLSDLTNEFKHRTIITTGVGQHQMWAAQHYRWRHPRTMLTSGGLGTMGYGLPAAIGAQIARPDCLVIDIDGDASFNMTIAELATAAKYCIPVKVLLFNNEQMGMVSDLQRLYYKEKFVHNRQKNPDFVLASEPYGVQVKRIESPTEMDEGLNWLLGSEGPAVLEVRTEQSSSVLPVVKAGMGLHEFITYPEQGVAGV